MSSSIPLTHAVTSGDESAVTALLAKGADVNETTSGGQTPLILAVIFGHTKLVELLVRAGADPELRDNLGLNAIEWARRRGSTDALDVLTNPPAPDTARKTVAKPEEPPQRAVPEPAPQPAPEAAAKEPVSHDEKSRQWIAGLKQRLNEQELRRLNRNEPPPERPQPVEEPAPPKVVPAKVVPAKQPPAIKRIFPLDPEPAEPATNHKAITTTEPVISESPPKRTSPLFWLLLVVTISASVAVGSLLTTFLFPNNATEPTAAVQPSTIQKGVPELGGELVGKAVSLPEAECPLRGPEPVSGTVTVEVKVDQDGKVFWARGAGGDWLMRGASTEAAMNSNFAPEKLRRSETEGTITYTFKP